MDLRKVKTLIDLVQQSDITELEITEGEEKVRITRGHPAGAVHHVATELTTRRCRCSDIGVDVERAVGGVAADAGDLAQQLHDQVAALVELGDHALHGGVELFAGGVGGEGGVGQRGAPVGEGDERGPSLCWRGFDNAGWYRLTESSHS